MTLRRSAERGIIKWSLFLHHYCVVIQDIRVLDEQWRSLVLLEPDTCLSQEPPSTNVQELFHVLRLHIQWKDVYRSLNVMIGIWSYRPCLLKKHKSHQWLSRKVEWAPTGASHSYRSGSRTFLLRHHIERFWLYNYGHLQLQAPWRPSKG